MRDVRVMFTASGSQFAPGTIKCLKQNGEREITVIGGDMGDDPTNRYLVDIFYKTPAARDPSYAEEVAKICEKEKVDILLPQMSAELPAYLEHMELFDKIGTRVSMTLTTNVNVANNKLALFEFLSTKGVSIPKFQSVHSMKEFDKAISLLGYPQCPVCVKMPESSGSRGIRIIDGMKSRFELFAYEKPASLYVTLQDMREILSEAEHFPDLILMPYLPGDEYTVDLLADKGKVLYIAGRRNPVMLMSISQEAILEKNERAYQIAEQVVRHLELDGNISLDFKFDANGDAQLLEVNPRLSATISVFAAGGLNLPYLRVKQLLGEQLPEVSVQYGVAVKRRYSEIFTDSTENLINW